MLVQLLADSLLNHDWNALEAGLVVAEILLVRSCVREIKVDIRRKRKQKKAVNKNNKYSFTAKHTHQ